MMQRIGSKFPDYAWYYVDNIEENIAVGPSFLILERNMRMYCWQYSMNKKYFWTVCLFGIISAVVFFHQLRKKRLKKYVPLWIGTGLAYYIVLTSGISYWQADRLTIIAFPAAVFSISGLLIYMFPKLTRKMQKDQQNNSRTDN